MSADSPDVNFFLTLEQELHRPDVRHSREAVSDLLADEFIEFGSSGRVYDKTAVVDALAREPADATERPDSFDFSIMWIAPDAVLLTYRSVGHSTEIENMRHVLRSSIWKRFDDQWKMIFHQGTVIPSG